jgi:hypothetical protein
VKEYNFESGSDEVELIVLASGFEDRAFAFLKNVQVGPSVKILLIEFANGLDINENISAKFRSEAYKKVGEDNVEIVEFKRENIAAFTKKFREKMLELSIGSSNTSIDISGMPTHLIFCVLNCVRSLQLYADQTIVYTSAQDYFPTRQEYIDLSDQQEGEIEYLPKSMALEMAENLVYEPFSGYRNSDTNSCLILFAGYEAHRSTGVVEAINPTLLLLVYGEPPSEDISWRTELSKRLHQKFENMMRCSTETISTQNVSDTIELLDTYYDFLIDDYDVTLAPLGSKLQTIGTYLFWERYPEIQINFPIPIGYDPSRRPIGVDTTYFTTLPGRLSFNHKRD